MEALDLESREAAGGTWACQADAQMVPWGRDAESSSTEIGEQNKDTKREDGDQSMETAVRKEGYRNGDTNTIVRYLQSYVVGAVLSSQHWASHYVPC